MYIFMKIYEIFWSCIVNLNLNRLIEANKTIYPKLDVLCDVSIAVKGKNRLFW